MNAIAPGASGEFELDVQPEHLANRFKDQILPGVLATPVMIMIMENAALNAIKPYLQAGESALGTKVDIVHLAATPAGRRVRGCAKVTKVEGRRITFDVSAWDGDLEIGRGQHERTTIDLAKFQLRLDEKYGTKNSAPEAAEK